MDHSGSNSVTFFRAISKYAIIILKLILADHAVDPTVTVNTMMPMGIKMLTKTGQYVSIDCYGLWLAYVASIGCL